MGDFTKSGMYKKFLVSISIKDVRRIVESLEFTADFDKTQVYYEMKEWLKLQEKN